MTTEIEISAPYALAANEGKPMSWFAATMLLKASHPALGVVETEIAPGDEPPLHVHKNEDEWFYVLEGDVTFHCGGQNMRGGAGAFISFPRQIPHTFTVHSPKAHFILMNTPGGFERMFEMAPKSVEEAVAALKAYDVEVVGPHPREAGKR